MKIEFLELAEKELKEAVQFYNKQSEGLGFTFAYEIQKTLERIIQYPEAWTKLSKRTRRCRCNKFPYGVIYTIKENIILIVAIMHLKREPGYWEKEFNK